MCMSEHALSAALATPDEGAQTGDGKSDQQER
jgi:hypothetical protein